MTRGVAGKKLMTEKHIHEGQWADLLFIPATMQFSKLIQAI